MGSGVGGAGQPRGQVHHVAERLREMLIDGYLRPGQRLPEDELAMEFGVSRPTLREGFRTLLNEGSLVHVLNRGVFVEQPGLSDLDDLYGVRKIIEPTVIAGLESGLDLKAVSAAVADGEDAVERGDWLDLVAANISFHEAVVELSGSHRLKSMVRRVLVETRLIFHAVPEPMVLHRRYAEKNRDICSLISVGEMNAGASAMSAYLEESRIDLREEFVRAGGWR